MTQRGDQRLFDARYTVGLGVGPAGPIDDIVNLGIKGDQQTRRRCQGHHQGRRLIAQPSLASIGGKRLIP